MSSDSRGAHLLSLSVLVTRQLRGNDAALAEWMQVKRVTLQGSRRIKESAAVTYSATTESVAPVTATATTVTATATTAKAA